MKRYGFLLGCIILVCGVMWSNLAFSNGAACQPKKACKESFVLAKFATTPQKESDCFSHFDCLTSSKPCDDCIIRIIRTLTLTSKDPVCDELANLIPGGSTLVVDLTYHIRRNGPCKTSAFPNGTPVGTHEGKFTIKNPAGGIIASGKMKGTNGLETHVIDDECCSPYHDEGCMEGIIKVPVAGTNTTNACKLTATYSSTLNFEPFVSDVCSKSYWERTWYLNIDGIVQCPCKTTRD